jgi:hypothetical protein
MKKTALLLIAVFTIFIGAACDKQPTTFDEALTMAAQSGKPVLVEFYSES